MEQAKVILKKGQGRSLKAGGAWIYDNEIDRMEGAFEEGDLVRVEAIPWVRDLSIQDPPLRCA